MYKKIKSWLLNRRGLRPLLSRVCDAIRQEKGTAALEASLVFPLLLLCTCAFMFFGMLVYMKVLTAHAAVYAVERSAFIWDNSHKDPVTGEFAPHEYDSLYWRTMQDQLLNTVFGGIENERVVGVTLPAAASDDSSLSERKLISGGAFVRSPLKGEMHYFNSMIERKITADLNHPARSSMLEKMTGAHVEVEGGAVGVIVEPAEFIRTVELARYMTTKFKSMTKLGASPEGAWQILKKEAKR